MIYPCYAQNFSIPEISKTLKGSQQKISVSWDKTFSDKTVIFFISKKFWFEKISETQKRSPTINNGTVRQRTFRQNRGTTINQKYQK